MNDSHIYPDTLYHISRELFVNISDISLNFLIRSLNDRFRYFNSIYIMPCSSVMDRNIH